MKQVQRSSPRPIGYRFGAWEVQSLLGQGSTGVVYDCVNVYSRELRAAVKELVFGGDPHRLRREATLLGRLEHPGVVRVRDLVLGEQSWIVMDRVDGQPLSERLPLLADRTLQICIGLAEALAYVHVAGVAHRDLKPSNILLVGDRPVLIDFGLGSGLGIGDASTVPLGTLAYMAPELLDERADTARPEATDIYALGLVFGEVYCGGPVFTLPSDIRSGVVAWLLRKKRTMPEIDPGECAPPAIRALVLSMTSREPDERPDATAVLQALRKVAVSASDLSNTAADTIPPLVQRPALPAPAAPSGEAPSTLRPPFRVSPSPPSSPVVPPRRYRLLRRGVLFAVAGVVAALVVGRENPQSEPLPCEPQREVTADGVDQDCDGKDRKWVWLYRQEGLLRATTSGAGSVIVPSDASGVASHRGPWLAHSADGGTRIRRLLDDLSLDEGFVVPARGPVHEDGRPGFVVLTDPSAGVVHRVSLDAGEITQSVTIAGVLRAVGRAGAPDVWAVVSREQGWWMARYNWIGQMVWQQHLPGPVDGLALQGDALVVTGTWGAGILRGESFYVLPTPTGMQGQTFATFADPISRVVWVAGEDVLAFVDPRQGRYERLSMVLAFPEREDADRPNPWFSPGTSMIARTLDMDGDGWPAEAWLTSDCDDQDPNRAPGQPDPEGDGGDWDCDGQDGPSADGTFSALDGVSRTTWTILDALQWTPIEHPVTVTIADQVRVGPPGSQPQLEVPAGARFAHVEADGYIPMLRPLGHGVGHTHQLALMVPAWAVVASGPKYGEWLDSSRGGLVTVAVHRRDHRANFAGVRFDVSPLPGAGAFVAEGEFDGQDVRVQPQYGWIFWRGGLPGHYEVTVTPPEGTLCWLPGDIEPLNHPISIDIINGMLTSVWIQCEDL